MELFKEMLIKVLMKEEINITFPNLKLGTLEAVEMEAFKALQKIKTIIADDSLSDFECVERIICMFEELGIDSIKRHDF